MGGIVSAVAGPVTGLVGGLLGGGKAADASRQQAEALRAAADKASGMAQFNPYGMTTNFGTSAFGGGAGSYQLSPELQSIQQRLFGQLGTYDPTQSGQAAQPLYGGAQSLFGLGQQILPSQYNTSPSAEAQSLSAQYQQAMQGLLPSSYQSTVSPEAQAAAQQYQQYSNMLAPTTAQTGASPQAQAYAQQLQQYANQLAPTSFQTGATPEAMQLAQQFRQTGQGYLAQSPEEARAEYMRTQQAALAPGRAAEEARLATANYGRGTGGLGVQTGTGSAPSNPLAQALFNARGQQDLQLAAQAEQAAQQRQAFGLSNLGQGLTTQQQSEQQQRANVLQNLGLSTQLAGTAYGTTASAEEVARQNMIQNLGLSTDLTGKALTTQQLSQQTSEQNLLNRLGLGLGYGTQAFRTTATAEDLARERSAQDIRLGAGLFGTGGELLGQIPKLTTAGYAPTEAQLGLLRTTESLGQQPFLLSQDLANQYAQSGARAGGLYLQPQQAASNAYAQYQGYSPIGSALGGLGSTISPGGSASSWFSGLFNQGPTRLA